jgi:hypothetical protein
MRTVTLSQDTEIDGCPYARGQVVSVPDFFDPALVGKVLRDRPEKSRLKDKTDKKDKNP